MPTVLRGLEFGVLQQAFRACVVQNRVAHKGSIRVVVKGFTRVLESVTSGVNTREGRSMTKRSGLYMKREILKAFKCWLQQGLRLREWRSRALSVQGSELGCHGFRCLVFLGLKPSSCPEAESLNTGVGIHAACFPWQHLFQSVKAAVFCFFKRLNQICFRRLHQIFGFLGVSHLGCKVSNLGFRI